MGIFGRISEYWYYRYFCQSIDTLLILIFFDTSHHHCFHTPWQAVFLRKLCVSCNHPTRIVVKVSFCVNACWDYLKQSHITRCEVSKMRTIIYRLSNEDFAVQWRTLSWCSDLDGTWSARTPFVLHTAPAATIMNSIYPPEYGLVFRNFFM